MVSKPDLASLHGQNPVCHYFVSQSIRLSVDPIEISYVKFGSIARRKANNPSDSCIILSLRPTSHYSFSPEGVMSRVCCRKAIG